MAFLRRSGKPLDPSSSAPQRRYPASSLSVPRPACDCAKNDASVPNRRGPEGTRCGPGGTEGRLAATVVRLLQGDRKSVGSGRSVSVRVDLGGRRIIKKKKKNRYRI